MGKLESNEKGFTAVEGLLIVLILVVIGAVGYMVYHNDHKTKTVNTANTPSSKAATTAKTTTTTTKTTTQTNPTAGWATYTSTLGGFSFKYPTKGWTLDGFQGYTPVSGSLMNGSETQVRLDEAGNNGTFSSYWIVINIGTVNQVGYESESYTQGTVSTLSNGLQAWLTNASAVSNPQCFSGSPIDLNLVSNGKFYYALPNGQYMSYLASFCYGQKDTTSLSYQQQVTAPEVTVAKEVLSSLTFK